MIDYDKSKVYSLCIMHPEKGSLTNAIVPGEHLEKTIEDYKGYYPDFKKIVVYEADTMEAIAIIKNNQ